LAVRWGGAAIRGGWQSRCRVAHRRGRPLVSLVLGLVFLVVAGLIGLVTLRQMRQVPAQARSTTRLRDIACSLEQVAQARPDEPAADLLPRLSECAEGRALVLSDGVLVGIVSPSDISSGPTLDGRPRRRRPARVISSVWRAPGWGGPLPPLARCTLT
jgi:hypothetical protein